MHVFQSANKTQELIKDVREHYATVYEQWNQVGKALAVQRGYGPAFEQLDANIDLLLRAIEADQNAATREFGDNLKGGAFFAQISLSRMWLLTMYETVRDACERTPCQSKNDTSLFCRKDSCLRCRLKTVLDRLSVFRTLLVESQPGEAARQQIFVINQDNGSVEWCAPEGSAGSAEVTSRLELSDFILNTLCADTPKGT